MRRLVPAIPAALLLAGCAFGRVRQAQMGPLGPYRDVASASVEVTGRGSPAVVARLTDAAVRELPAGGGLEIRQGDPGSYRLVIDVLDETAAPAQQAAADGVLSSARTLLGVASRSAGQLSLEARLFPPGAQKPVGAIAWESEGDPGALADAAAADLATALRSSLERRRDDFVARRAADERLVLTPTPLTMEPGEFAVSDDEVLLARLAVGVSRRLQLDMFAGGLPIPAGTGGVFAERAIMAGGVGAVAVIGFFDLGVKLALLHETARVPGVALSYDMLDLFALAGGGGGIVLLADGAGGAGLGVVGGANVQFNVFTVTAGKHFGNAQLTAGTWIVDNHHFLPQSAGFQTAYVAGAASPGATGGVVYPTGGASTAISRFPTQVRPFAGFEYVFGPHVSAMAEVLPGEHLATSFASSGVRFLIGANHPGSVLALDRIRLRLDLAAIWSYLPAEADTASAKGHGARVLPLPWAGIGVYFL